MFSIINGAGLVLPLPKEFTTTIERVNPLFNKSDEFFQDLNYPGTVPLIDPVKLFVGHAHLPESPNSSHSFPVMVLVEGTPLSEGLFIFNIRGDNLEFNLELNYTALNALIKDIRITDIRTYDQMDLVNEANYTALMTETVLTPEKHPFIFFPLYNKGQTNVTGTGIAPTYRPFINYYDSDADKFKMTVFVPFVGNIYGNGQQPFYKLVYLLKQVISYLGYTAEGSLFTDPDFANICVLTRYSSGLMTIAEMSKYMPNLLISDLLKFVRNRFHVSVDVNAATKVIKMSTLSLMIKSDEVVDLSRFVGAMVEIELTDARSGFNVTIKPDEQDANFTVTFDGTKETLATEKLIVGDGAEEIELECTTPKTVDLSTPTIPNKRYASTDQTIINHDNWSGFPPDITEVTALGADPSKTNNWPLKLARFIGMRDIPGGKRYPCSEGVDLGQDDIDFYRFLTSGKRIILTCYLPPSDLITLDLTKKYCYRTPDLNYIELVIEKFVYDIGDNMDVIPVKIYALVTTQSIDAKAAVVPIVPPDEPSVYTFGYISAYFDQATSGLEQVDIDLIGIGSAAGNTYKPVTIVSSTNPKGAGGVPMPIVWLSGPGFYFNELQLRIKRGRPKYIERLGIRQNFTWSGNYWYVDIGINQDNALNIFVEPYWIVF